jgi:hypothetical protein
MSDGADDADGANDEVPAVPAPRVRTTRGTAAALPACQPSARGSNLLDRIADSLDPQHQVRHETERTSALFQSQQLIMLQGQIRDLNQTIQTLEASWMTLNDAGPMPIAVWTAAAAQNL